jgi:hypothetical protein
MKVGLSHFRLSAAKADSAREIRMGTSEEEDSGKQSPKGHRSSERARLLEKAIQKIEEKLGANDVKATFGDFIRLLQLQKELQVDEPKEIKVTWIEPTEKESASEE